MLHRTVSIHFCCTSFPAISSVPSSISPKACMDRAHDCFYSAFFCSSIRKEKSQAIKFASLIPLDQRPKTLLRSQTAWIPVLADRRTAHSHSNDGQSTQLSAIAASKTRANAVTNSTVNALEAAKLDNGQFESSHPKSANPLRAHGTL